jgi:hypothetical protein
MQEYDIYTHLLERAKSLEAKGDVPGADEIYSKILSANSSHAGWWSLYPFVWQGFAWYSKSLLMSLYL